jgi:hypothetical protein
VRAGGKPVGALNIIVDVSPIKLTDPPFGLGLNYSRPDNDTDGRVLAAHLRDMREHGMTCVAPLYNWHQPVHDTDTSELGALLEAYKKAGFPGTFYWAPPMGLQLTDLAGYGDETSRRWQQKYIQVMRLMYDEIRQHGVPAVFSIGDELTNKGMEGVGIADDWTLYADKGGLRFPDDGFAKVDPEKVSSFGRWNALRLDVAHAILALQAVQK